MTDKPRPGAPRASPAALADGLGFDPDRALKNDHENASRL